MAQRLFQHNFHHVSILTSTSRPFFANEFNDSSKPATHSRFMKERKRPSRFSSSSHGVHKTFGEWNMCVGTWCIGPTTTATELKGPIQRAFLIYVHRSQRNYFDFFRKLRSPNLDTAVLQLQSTNSTPDNKVFFQQDPHKALPILATKEDEAAKMPQTPYIQSINQNWKWACLNQTMLRRGEKHK